MNCEDLHELLRERDKAINTAAEFEAIDSQSIENEAIRELGKIVMETTAEDGTFYSST